MRKLIKTETYSGLKGELIKLTGKDIIIKPSMKYNETVEWGYQILINDKPNMLINKYTDLRKVKSIFAEEYRKESYSKIWRKEK